MASEVSRVQEPEPRRWPIGSKQPTDADLRVQSTQNGVIFKSLANGRRWHAEPDSPDAAPTRLQLVRLGGGL